jgi:UDP-N-acetylglucosamine 2-epimerase (non-hydrolysing)
MSGQEISIRHPVMVVLGTRPEVIKLVPVILALRDQGVPTYVLSTGQHREMLEQMLGVFGLEPDHDLHLMRPDQSLASLSAHLLQEMDTILAQVEPSWVLVQGDTTTVAMVALAAFYRRIAVAHVEAGLRTGVKYNPFPEEMNRTLLGPLADLHFAPTEQARQNLLREGVPENRVSCVGNTVIDALHLMGNRVAGRTASEFGLRLPTDRRLVLVTGHRRENFGEGLRNVFGGLRRLAEEFSQDIHVLYPVHLNPHVRRAAEEVLVGIDNVQLTEPLDYAAFVKAMTRAEIIITDSGGVQEEAASLGIPVLVTRETSERQEAIEAGVAELVGTDGNRLFEAACKLLKDPLHHAARAVPSDVFGDGCSGTRIAAILAAHIEKPVALGT